MIVITMNGSHDATWLVGFFRRNRLEVVRVGPAYGLAGLILVRLQMPTGGNRENPGTGSRRYLVDGGLLGSELAFPKNTEGNWVWVKAYPSGVDGSLTIHSHQKYMFTLI